MNNGNIIRAVPGQLTLDQLQTFYLDSCQIEFDQNCRRQVEQAAEMVQAAASGEDAIYGVNTGFGKLANTRVSLDQTSVLQKNLILSHCCGVGPALPESIVRLTMLLKLCSLGRGASGVRWQILELLQAMLNADILPIIPSKGSVGASGDLAPLAHMTLAMIGEGEVMRHGERMPTSDALQDEGLCSIKLGPKEGLAMINGTQVSTAICLTALFDTWNLCQTAMITGALSCDALMASTSPFRKEIHELRGQPGQIDVARSLQSLLAGSKIRESHLEDDERVQDPYCLRCQPQVMGACLDQLRQAAKTLEIEANAVTDNPLVINGEELVSGGNFHAEPVAFAADQCALAIAETGSIAERRIATLVDPALNYGLPGFLSPDPGRNSGFMAAEVTAAALMAENKHNSMPCSVDSTPTSANQEDHVAMSCHAARRLLEMNENLTWILGIELLAAAQGVEFRRPLKSSKTLEKVIRLVRDRIPALGEDRFLAPDLEDAYSIIKSRSLFDMTGDNRLPTLWRLHGNRI